MHEQRRFTHKSGPKITTRADGKKVIEGYAAVFFRADDPGTQYDLGWGMIERIAPTAFNRALAEGQDVVCRFDHEVPLGRTSSGTVRLTVDAIGLRYECDYPDTQCGRDTATLIERGDIKGSSFAFRATKTMWMDSGDDSEDSIRQIEDCDLFDVGPVVFPAYASTTTGVRAASDEDATAVKAERDEWRSKQPGTQDDADEVAVRLALIALDD